MRFTPVFVLALLCTQLAAESWFGFCIIERNNRTICNEAQAQRGDFSPICDAFARREGAAAWRARFATSLDQLRSSMPDHCDIVRDGGQNSLFACQLAIMCQGAEQATIKHLASRVYAKDEGDAITACHEKEDWRYQQALREQSTQGCFVRIAVEAMNNNK